MCGRAPPDLEFPRHPLVEFAPYAATVSIEDQKNSLLGRLAKHMRAACLAAPKDSRAAKQYRILIDELKDSFEVGIYNLNYDIAAIGAFPEAFTGFSESGTFDPLSVHRRTEWNFIYHLHGSVHHSFATEHGAISVGDKTCRTQLASSTIQSLQLTISGQKRNRSLERP